MKQVFDISPIIKCGLLHILGEFIHHIGNIWLGETQVLRTVNNCRVLRWIKERTPPVKEEDRWFGEWTGNWLAKCHASAWKDQECNDIERLEWNASV